MTIQNTLALLFIILSSCACNLKADELEVSNSSAFSIKSDLAPSRDTSKPGNYQTEIKKDVSLTQADYPDTLTTTNVYDNYAKLNAKNYLNIDIISRVHYDSLISHSPEYITNDSAKITLKDTILNIKLDNEQYIQFVSTPYADELMVQYEYLGHINSLNLFMLALHYWESQDYKFYSTENGVEIYQMGSYPHFSPNGSKTIGIYANPYESLSEVVLTEIKNNGFKQIWNIEFTNWMFADYEKDNFIWIDEYSFIIKVIQTKQFWNTQLPDKEKIDYLKVSLVN